MNKVILMGRLTRDPEVRYSQSAQPTAVARYGIAVNRQFKKEGQPDVDFINCVAFGKTGEFAEKYFKKGQMVAVCGKLQVSTYEDQNNQKRTSTDVIVEDQYFAESKQSFESRMATNGGGSNAGASVPTQESKPNNEPNFNSYSETNGFMPIDDSVDDDELPF